MCSSRSGSEAFGVRDGSRYISGARQRGSSGMVDRSDRWVGIWVAGSFSAGVFRYGGWMQAVALVQVWVLSDNEWRTVWCAS
ncbi:hypothetical protein EV2_023306 [Malus domestica]